MVSTPMQLQHLLYANHVNHNVKHVLHKRAARLVKQDFMEQQHAPNALKIVLNALMLQHAHHAEMDLFSMILHALPALNIVIVAVMPQPVLYANVVTLFTLIKHVSNVLQIMNIVILQKFIYP